MFILGQFFGQILQIFAARFARRLHFPSFPYLLSLAKHGKFLWLASLAEDGHWVRECG